MEEHRSATADQLSVAWKHGRQFHARAERHTLVRQNVTHFAVSSEMKTPAIKRLRKKLAADLPVYGLWVTLESASITEMGVALGLDWIVIDAEHGHLDWKDILEHVRAAVRSETVVLVRVAELNGGLIKRVLDIGADGVVIPWIETAAQLKQALAVRPISAGGCSRHRRRNARPAGGSVSFSIRRKPTRMFW